jgi:hypothetical protein
MDTLCNVTSVRLAVPNHGQLIRKSLATKNKKKTYRRINFGLRLCSKAAKQIIVKLYLTFINVCLKILAESDK